MAVRGSLKQKTPAMGSKGLLLKYVKHYEHHKYTHNFSPTKVSPIRLAPGLFSEYKYPRVVKWFKREVVMGHHRNTPPLAALGWYPL